jgi:hypothetical protein
MDGLLGQLLGHPEDAQPVGGDHEQPMRVTALQSDGIPFGFTTYRPADLTGFYPEWRQWTMNVGDVDLPPVSIPMGPRHYSINARTAPWR